MANPRQPWILDSTPSISDSGYSGTPLTRSPMGQIFGRINEVLFLQENVSRFLPGGPKGGLKNEVAARRGFTVLACCLTRVRKGRGREFDPVITFPFIFFQTPATQWGYAGSGFYSLSVELWSCIPIVSEIPDSLSWIPDSEAQDCGFHKTFSRILESEAIQMSSRFK